MNKKTEWLAAIGIVISAIILASVQRKREMEKEAEYVRKTMTLITVVALKKPE